MRHEPLHSPHGVGLNVVVALCYLLAAWAGLEAEVADDVAARFWPAAGVSLAAFVLHGRRVLPGVVAGSLAFVVLQRLLFGPPSTLYAAIVWAGEVAQPMLAYLLLRRSLGPNSRDWLLQDPFRFLLIAGPVCSIIGSTLGPLGLVATGYLPPAALPHTALYAWLGGTIGVWVAAPLILCYVLGSDSRLTRTTAVLTVALALIVGTTAVRMEEAQRAERLASEWSAATHAVSAHFEQLSVMLRATAAFFESSEAVAEDEFTRFTEGFLREHPEVRIAGFARVVPGAERKGYESLSLPRSNGHAILERTADGSLGSASLRDCYLPVELAAPSPESEGLLGYDLASDGGLMPRLGPSIIDGGPCLIFPDVEFPRGRAFAFVPAIQPHVPQEVLGVAFARFDLGGLIEDAIGPTCEGSAHIEIVDRSGRTPKTIYSNRPLSPAILATAPNAGLVRRSLDVPGGELEFVVHPRIESASILPGARPMFTLFCSLLAAAFFTTVIAIVGDRKSLVERTVEDRTEELRRARDRAEAADRAKSDFLANMSHEIRTPMNGVLGIIDILDRTKLDSDQVELVGTMRSCGTSLLTILNDILDMSKVESGRLDLESVPYSIRDLAMQILETHRAVSTNRGLTLRSELSSDIPDLLVGDPTRVGQILGNLVGNAIKFTTEGHVVLRISTLGSDERTGEGRVPGRGERGPASRRDERSVGRSEGRGEQLLIEVEDTGSGIPREKVAGLFDAFTQADSSTTRLHGGSGLGLAIARSLAELMGGRISAESEVGRGSTFRLELPLHRCSASVADPATRPTPIPDVATPVRGTHRSRPAAATMDLAIPQTAPTSGSAPTAESTTEPSATPATNERAEHAAAEPTEGAAQVLLVEDNSVNRMIARRLLERLGCAVTEAEHGGRAVASLAEQRFDVVLMDCAMPEMDGLEATRRIRQREEAVGVGRTPIIALTANVFEENVRECLAAGMDAHLGKPVRASDLERTLLPFLGRHPQDPSVPVANRQERPGMSLAS